MRAFVTGAGGFVGQHLCRLLLEREWEVIGTTFGDPPPYQLLRADEIASMRWVKADLRRPGEIAAALDVAGSLDAVIHLAGVTFVPTAGADPGSAVEVNVVAPARLVGELRRRVIAGAMNPLILVVGSGEQYGRHDTSAMPLAETAALRPLSVYAATKVAQEALALQAHRADGLRVVCTRSFNHSGAGQPQEFVLPSLVQRVLAARSSAARTISVGNTSTIRDFTHVRDVVEAYLLLIERGVPGEVYNVSSGIGSSVADLLDRVLDAVGTHVEPFADPGLVRKVEVPALVGDNAKVRSATGWAPRLNVNDIIRDLIDATAR